MTDLPPAPFPLDALPSDQPVPALAGLRRRAPVARQDRRERLRATFGPVARLWHAARRRIRSGLRIARARPVLPVLALCAVPALAAAQAWGPDMALFRIGNAVGVIGGETAIEPMPFEQAGQSFPGSAFYYLAPDAAAGQPLADGARWEGESFAGPAARALRAGGTALDRTRALTCLTQAIYYEAASEPDAGQRAVAQVVLNRVAHPAYPKTVCGVVYQGAERTTGCQFTFTCDGALARVPNRLFWQRAETVARAALAGFVYAPVGLSTHYHTIAVHPYWADSLSYVGTIGAHRFYRFGGPAGAPATFNVAAYRGGEPVAAPPPRAARLASPDAPLDPLAIERAYAQGYNAAQAAALAPVNTVPMSRIGGFGAPPANHPAPAYAPALQARGGDALYTAQTLPESQGVRPEYAGSGQWIARPGS